MERDFLIDPDDIEFFPETFAALAAIKDDYVKIVVSNQSGIARGYFTSNDVENINLEISRRLASKGISIDGWYFCPHGPEENCTCRKPGIGMILEAAKDYDIDLNRSWIIGDKSSDIGAGKASGLKTILVKTGYGGREPEAVEISPDFIASNIGEAVDYINRSLS